MNTIIKQDNNISIGIFKQFDGSFMALTRTQSKSFKTYKGAVRWLNKRGY